jgi:hypothetical protein
VSYVHFRSTRHRRLHSKRKMFLVRLGLAAACQHPSYLQPLAAGLLGLRQTWSLMGR